MFFSERFDERKKIKMSLIEDAKKFSRGDINQHYRTCNHVRIVESSLSPHSYPPQNVRSTMRCADLNEESVIIITKASYDGTSQPKIVLEHPISKLENGKSSNGVKRKHGRRKTHRSSDEDERIDSLELDPIMEETEGDEQELGLWRPRNRNVRSKKTVEKRKLKAKKDGRAGGKRRGKGKGKLKAEEDRKEDEKEDENEEERKANQNELLEKYDHYDFQIINPLLNLENPFQEAMERMNKGEVTTAILCLEAALRHSPPYTFPKNAIAWLFLGLCQAANENDVLAIAAFRECLKLDPVNQNALMSLSISYANQNHLNLAINSIWKWFCNEPNYHDVAVYIPPIDPCEMKEPMDREAHEKLFRKLLMTSHTCRGGFGDADINCALGIMYTLVGDHPKSVEYFNRCALLRPVDERMWNRLGSCLARDNRHREAIKAFSNAIKLVPGYARAEFNWSISCYELGDKAGAIEHALKSLKIQAKSVWGLAGPMSLDVWNWVGKLMMKIKQPALYGAVEDQNIHFLCDVFQVD